MTNTIQPTKSLDEIEIGVELTKDLEDTQEAQTLIEIKNENTLDLPKDWNIPRDMSIENVIGDIFKGVSTRIQLGQFFMNVAFVS